MPSIGLACTQSSLAHTTQADGSSSESFEDCDYIAKDSDFLLDHCQRRLVQDRVARRAGIAHSDAPVAEINGGSQCRTHTDFCRDARLISLSIPRAVRHLLQRSVPECTGGRVGGDNLT